MRISILPVEYILTAHNCVFDYPRLMNAIEKVYLKLHFQSVTGFCDTLPIIKKKTKNKIKGANKLENLARDLNIDCDKVHDVFMLNEVINKLGFSESDLRNCMFSWIEAENKINFTKNLPNTLKKLEMLKDCVSYNMRK